VIQFEAGFPDSVGPLPFFLDAEERVEVLCMPIKSERLQDGIVNVTLDNPARHNAVTHEMLMQLVDIWQDLDHDDSVRVVILSGAGDQAFCTGADLSANLHLHAGIDDLIEKALLKTALFSKPLIAAITGFCVAGGLELALAADIRIARDDAKLGLPEVRWGILPSGGAAMKLIDQIGHAKAMDLLLTGRLIDGVQAERIGLVTEARPAAEVWPTVLERAMLIAANSPVAVRAAKQAALAERCLSYQSREAGERCLTALVRESGHQRIGIEAFLARRVPQFTD
jgi:enoyl-CoA hydratase/carnithine racemase